jgi:hypothetical protein
VGKARETRAFLWYIVAVLRHCALSSISRVFHHSSVRFFVRWTTHLQFVYHVMIAALGTQGVSVDRSAGYRCREVKVHESEASTSPFNRKN